MNCMLFVRTNRGVHLTSEGERLYELLRCNETVSIGGGRIIRQCGFRTWKHCNGVSEYYGAQCLSVGSSSEISYVLSRGAVRRFYNHSTPQAIHSVRNGEIDFAVVTTPTNLEVPSKEIHLQEFKEILVGGKTFAGLAEAPLSVEEVKKYPFICLEEMGTATYRFYYEWMLTYGIELVPDIEAATTDQILPLVKSELGWHSCQRRWQVKRYKKAKLCRFRYVIKCRNDMSVWYTIPNAL